MNDHDLHEHLDEQEAYRSAGMNAALAITAASPFLNAGAQWALGKLTEGGDEPPATETIWLPPGSDDSDT